MTARTILTIENAAGLAISVVEYFCYAIGVVSIVGFGIATGWLG